MKLFFLKTTYLLGQESKCVSKQVGCVIAKDKRIISTGYNGTPPKFKNCSDQFPDYDPALHREEHHTWSKIYEVHAEMNAIRNIDMTHAKHIDIVMIRVKKNGKIAISKPCYHCLQQLRKIKTMRNIHYINQDGIMVKEHITIIENKHICGSKMREIREIAINILI